MPKPVKKSREKPKGKRPSADPNLRARQLMDEHMGRVQAPGEPGEPEATPPHGDVFKAQLSAHMAAIGRRGGKIGGKRRLQTLTAERRAEIGKQAAEKRWKMARKRPTK